MTLLYGYNNKNKCESYINKILERHQYESNDKHGYLYIAVTPDYSLCKIGFSSNPKLRLRQFNSQTRQFNIPKMTLVYETPYTLQQELSLHKLFEQYQYSLKTKRKTRNKIWGYKFNGQIGLTEVYRLQGKVYEFVYNCITSQTNKLT